MSVGMVYTNILYICNTLINALWKFGAKKGARKVWIKRSSWTLTLCPEKPLCDVSEKI